MYYDTTKYGILKKIIKSHKLHIYHRKLTCQIAQVPLYNNNQGHIIKTVIPQNVDKFKVEVPVI